MMKEISLIVQNLKLYLDGFVMKRDNIKCLENQTILSALENNNIKARSLSSALF